MYINEIINDEINGYLNESFSISDDRFKFSANLKNSSFYNYDSFTTEYDTDIIESDIVITWRVNFWLNKMGIENMQIEIENVDGSYLLQLYDKQTNELKQESSKNIQDTKWKYIIDDTALLKGGSLYITELNFDFKDNTCMVHF